MIKFHVDGEPQPKQRPRVGTHGAYTPQRTKGWELALGWACREAMRDQEPLSGHLKVELAFRRHSKHRVDLDNLIKAVDGLNGVAWDDDSQIVELHATLKTGVDNPGVDVKISQIGK